MKCRIAKHTHDIPTLSTFYQKILGFSLIGHFKDHSGYDGIFFAYKNESWHLEFTQSNESFEKNTNPDDLLALYHNQEEYEVLLSRIKNQSIEIIKTKNPYWNRAATCIQDPDGNIICIQKPS